MKFLFPNYLAGLFLISVPIIIHLFFRKNLRKIYFSSLLFLRSSDAARLRWLKLKEILILILRCLMVASLFLALARPQYEGKMFARNRLSAVFLAIDNSFSMGYGNNFESAIERAEKVITSYSSRSIFCIMPLCPQRDYDYSWVSKNMALDQLKEIKLSYATGYLKNLYEKFIQKKTDLPKDFIYIGDGQVINFKDIDHLDNAYWIPISTGSNVVIEEVSVRNPYVLREDYYELKVIVKNYGVRPYHGIVKLTIGYTQKEQECIIPPGQDAIIFFSIPVSICHGVIRIEGDSLPYDNQYYFSKSLLTKIKVLIVDKERYIKTALSPSSTIKSPFEVELTLNIKNKDMQLYHVILLNGIDEITDYELLKLQNFLTNSRKGVIVCLGNRAGAQLKKLIADAGDFKNWINFDGYINIKWIDPDYAPFSIFRSSVGLKTIKFFRSWEITPKAKVLVKLDNNLPLLINYENLMVFATAFNESNTDIIYNPNFIPLLHSIIYGLVNKNIDNEYRVDQILDKIEFYKFLIDKYKMNISFLKPGFYHANGETISLNINPIESNTATITEEVARNLGIKTISDELLGGSADLTNIFLIIVLLTFLLEIIFLII
ncbi:MAG: BatA domain-containing protein [candidate division WOR-3 bacterium]